MSTIQVNSSWASLTAGTKVTVDGVDYTLGTDAFADIQSAVNASSTTEATTIMVADGVYDGDVVFQAAVTPQKADIIIKAIGGNAVINGEVILGYRKQGVGAAEWTSGVVLDGFTLNQPADGSPCVTVQYIKSFEMSTHIAEKLFSLLHCEKSLTVRRVTYDCTASASCANFKSVTFKCFYPFYNTCSFTVFLGNFDTFRINIRSI